VGKVENEFNDWGNIKVFNYQKERSIEYLQNVASTATSGGAFTVGKLKKGGRSPHGTVHTKLMLVDDEFSVIGSANFSQRSMTHDNEIMLIVITGSPMISGSGCGGSISTNLRQIWKIGATGLISLLPRS
jgi:hypothetical protein